MWFMAGLHTCSIFYYLQNICADLCQTALLPQLDLFFLICVALVLYSHIFICHWCISCRKWQHLMETSWKLNDSSQRAPPETKCATTFWWEHDLNHYSYKTSLKQNLELKPQIILVVTSEKQLDDTSWLYWLLFSDGIVTATSKQATEWPGIS